MAWIAEVVRNRRRLIWLAVPTVALAAIVVVTRTHDMPAGDYADLPHAKVRSWGVALPPEHLEEAAAKDNGRVVLGQVVDEQERPVAGAQVLVRGSDPTLTADDGTFTLRDVRDYKKFIVRTDELTTGYQYEWGRHPDDAERVTFHMHRGATITVHAVESDRRTPISGAKIALGEFQDAVTGADGTVTFHNVAYVWVTASAPEHGAVSLSPNGEERAVDGGHYWVSLPKGAPLAGIVVDPQGRPLPHGEIEISTVDAPTWHRDSKPIRADEHGAWRLEGLAPGTYDLTGHASGFASGAPIRIHVDGATARTGLVIRVVYGAQLVGTVVDSTGSPAPNARVAIESFPRRWETRTDAHGRFRFQGMWPGSYGIEATIGREASRRLRIDLVADRRLDVELTTVPSTVEGTVVDSKGRPAAGVAIDMRNQLDLTSRSARTDASGHFEITAPNGEYWTRLITHGTVVADIDLRIGDHNVKLVMPGKTKIKGRVLLHGKPVHAFVIHISYSGEVVREENHLTDMPRIASTDGRFTIDGVYAGRRAIVIAGDDFPTGTLHNVEIPEGDSFDLGDVDVDALDRM
jgi:protocatechuate 3,4-dioxygenase beta subunit